MSTQRCGIILGRAACDRPVEPGAELNLCTTHLLAAYDWMAREVGVTDILPSACIACGSRVGVRYPSGWICARCEWRVGDLPDGATVQPHVEVVYYLRFRDRVKIGTSGNPRQRLTQLKHDELLGLERGGRALEQRRHAEFARYRFDRTEWFTLSPELETHIAALNPSVDPWDDYALWRSREIALHG